jgi:hypothetical protein
MNWTLLSKRLQLYFKAPAANSTRTLAKCPTLRHILSTASGSLGPHSHAEVYPGHLRKKLRP